MQETDFLLNVKHGRQDEQSNKACDCHYLPSLKNNDSVNSEILFQLHGCPEKVRLESPFKTKIKQIIIKKKSRFLMH